mgnify:CR=1 FL=1
MPFDVYAGPLCRYFSRDFETPTSRMAREGAEASDPGDSLPSSLELGPVIRGWQRLITPALRSAGVPTPEWNESLDGAAIVEPLTFSGYWSIRVAAAYAESPDLVAPASVPAEASLPADPALARLAGQESRSRFGHLHACAWWLPVRMAEPTDLELPSGIRQPVGSVGMLRAELTSLARTLGTELGQTSTDRAGTLLHRVADDALRRWFSVVDHAHREQVPVILDY